MSQSGRNPFRVFVLTFGLAAAGIWMGCDTGDPIGSADVTLDDVQAEVFDVSCIGCHSGDSAPEGMDLTSGESYANTVDVPSVQVPDLMRVEPGDAENSYLYIKITGDERIADGTFQMPVGGSLTDEQIDLVRDWINAGAER